MSAERIWRSCAATGAKRVRSSWRRERRRRSLSAIQSRYPSGIAPSEAISVATRATTCRSRVGDSARAARLSPSFARRRTLPGTTPPAPRRRSERARLIAFRASWTSSTDPIRRQRVSLALAISSAAARNTPSPAPSSRSSSNDIAKGPPSRPGRPRWRKTGSMGRTTLGNDVRVHVRCPRRATRTALADRRAEGLGARATATSAACAPHATKVNL